MNAIKSDRKNNQANEMEMVFVFGVPQVDVHDVLLLR